VAHAAQFVRAQGSRPHHFCRGRRWKPASGSAFLPGDLRGKRSTPYLRPIYDALYDLMDSRDRRGAALQGGEIEIAPLAFMRGRTPDQTP